jgi:hypothetical protein
VPINNGIIRLTACGEQIVAEIYYSGDPEGTPFNPPAQAIIERGTPPAACRVSNTTGKPQMVTVAGPGGPLIIPGQMVTAPDGSQAINVPTGTTRIRASQLASIGITTRDDVLFSLSADCG